MSTKLPAGPRLSDVHQFHGYDLNKHVSARLTVNNLFDKSVPFPYAVSQTRYFDALMGRYFKLNMGVKF